jgi:hypothetical protein
LPFSGKGKRVTLTQDTSFIKGAVVDPELKPLEPIKCVLADVNSKPDPGEMPSLRKQTEENIHCGILE